MMGKGLLDTLYSECEGKMEIRALKPGEKPLTHYVELNDMKAISDVIRKHRNRNLYFAIATRDGEGGKKENIVHIPALWVDIDWKTLPEGQKTADKILSDFPLQPTVIVCSGGGYHCYWKLKEPADKDEIPAVERVLYGLAFALQGDPSCAEAAHILRIPNTTNWKYQIPRKVVMTHCNGSEFALSDFDFLPEPSEIPKKESKREQGKNLDRIMQCVFMQHCKDHASNLTEPEWRSMITQLMKEPGGIALIHRLSKPYPKYKRTETDKKILDALDTTGPHSCSVIKNLFQCGQLCRVTSPAGLAFKNVTNVTSVISEPFVTGCNQTPPDPPIFETSVTDVTEIFKSYPEVGKSITPENLMESVKNWLETCDGTFTIRELAQEMQFTVQSICYNNLKLILKRLVDQNKICRVGQVRGVYRKREEDTSLMPWWEGEGEDEFALPMPLDLSEICKLYPKNIVVIAGSKDAGKTALSLNIARMNMGLHEVHYFTSEMASPELRARLSAFRDMDLKAWRGVQFHDIKENFSDHILRYPDALHIIDFLEIHEDFWRVGGSIRQVYDALRKGLCIINLQKKTNAQFAKGGEITIEKARLYLGLERKFDAQVPYTEAKIVSAKIPRVYGDSPGGLIRNFRIDWGWRIEPLMDWERPPEPQPKRTYRNRYPDD